MHEETNIIHIFDHQPNAKDLPLRFNCPFHYHPHPLAIKASEEVKSYLMKHEEWHKELEHGKMFGVLIVEHKGQIGFIAAYSGILDGKNNHGYFVPPVYDMLQPDGWFKTEEHAISNINKQIKSLRASEERQALTKHIDDILQQQVVALEEHRVIMQEAKAKRDSRRQCQNITTLELEDMVKESQFLKAEYKRLVRHWTNIMDDAKMSLNAFDKQIELLDNERKQRSATLQQWLFRQFIIHNAKGETKDLIDIFNEYGRPLPPSGSGECAAPKLLQYAFIHNMRPITMAEFWWGKSPHHEIRQHGCFYPSCTTKCEPILHFMLQGMDVEPNPQKERQNEKNSPIIIYEDEWLVAIDKPAGMLSVPGKDDAPSIWDWAKGHYPEADGPIIVHRLDMDTSGILILTKDKETHQLLQKDFETQKVKKRYIAIVNGHVAVNNGIIQLPICPNPNDRPRQMVSNEHGKPSTTRFEVIASDEKQTRLALFPVTGRTHQLRVHCAHQNGLNAPIKGDNLYGQPSDRLYLHAQNIEFKHPRSGKTIRLESPAPF